MIRALVALLGFAAAAVLLAIAPNAGSLTGDDLWYVAGVWAAAGLVAGFFYQAGGVRRPGMRLNAPLLVLTFLPWTLLTGAAIVQVAEPGSDMARLARDILPDTWLAHWVMAMSALAFGSGLLLALSLVEPRVQVNRIVTVAQDEQVVADDRDAAPATMATAPAMDTGHQTTIADGATDLDEQPTPAELRAREDAAREEGAREQATRDDARLARTRGE